MKKFTAILVAILAAATFTACGNSGADVKTPDITADGEKVNEYARGTITDNLYVSDWSGIQIDIPEKMYCLTDSEMNEVLNLGLDILIDSEAVQNYAKKTTVYEFYAMDMANGEFMFMTVEKLPYSSFSVEDYAGALKRQFDSLATDSGMTVEYLEECVDVNYGGVEASQFDAVVSVSGVEMRQSYILKKIDDRMITICASTMREDGIADIFSGISALE